LNLKLLKAIVKEELAECSATHCLLFINLAKRGENMSSEKDSTGKRPNTTS
jgi:hypothetical protein